MFDTSYAQKKIESMLDAGCLRFVIFPYGKNGVELYRMLRDNYGVDDRNIIRVDNKLSKYSDKIISSDMFIARNYQDAVVFITAENREINKEILERIDRYVMKDRIINLFEKEVVVLKAEKYELKDFWLIDFYEVKTNNKKSIHILLSSKNDIITIRSVIEALLVENDITIVLITTCKISDIRSQINYVQITIMDVEEYIQKYREMKPSIFIIMHPYGKERRLYQIRSRANTVIALYTGVYDGLKSEFLAELLKTDMEKYSPDYYLFDGYIYAQAENIDWLKPRAIRVGNPKYDAIYAAIKDKRFDGTCRKKTILWATDHGVYSDYIAQDCTLDKYLKTIVNYAKHNHDINVIFRPHPVLVSELEKLNIWTSREICMLKEIFNEIGNIELDLSNTYEDALKRSDAVITDGFCGIVLSALPTMLPICRTFRNKNMIPSAEYELQGYYDAYNEDDIIDFLDMVKKGDDPLIEQRRNTCKKYVVGFNGNNGKRIKELLCSLL